ncbi:MAG: DUF4344 domain-containing metallopeptidase [Reichenbachiella sp.]|uniref:DUF4344 domain-containing metallopeptidase n=1 Tax=Reichenbachiella sp. TaxID=2184521 RepID=UPI0032648DD9
MVSISAILQLHAAKIFIRFEKPTEAKHQKIYKVLKSNNRQMLGESIKYLEGLYTWTDDVQIVVASCGSINSRYEPDRQLVVLCYESLHRKIYNYAEAASSKAIFERRVFQNSMFTFWHEIGHVVLDQLDLANGLDSIQIELLADEFATLSLIWREGSRYKDVVLINALHFKSQSMRQSDKKYKAHPKDQLRYEKMITLLYGFKQKSYSRLSDEVGQIEWLNMPAKEYYFERSAYWEQNLRKHTKFDFFNN